MSLRSRVFPEPWMRWYDLPVLKRINLARWSFTRKGWHREHKRLARFRALYWVLIRGHDSEICAVCGSPVHVVYIVPDTIWEAASGYSPPPGSSESASGVLCPYCLDDLYTAAVPRGPEGFLRWTCSTDDSAYEAWVASHPLRTMPEPDPVRLVGRGDGRPA